MAAHHQHHKYPIGGISTQTTEAKFLDRNEWKMSHNLEMYLTNFVKCQN